MKRVAIYARVSTGHQDTDLQLTALREVAARSGWQVVAELVDQGISGAKGRKDRPAFDQMWKMVTRREVDMIAAWAIDRVGRSLTDLVNFAAECDARGVGMYFDRQAIDTSTPVGRMFFQIVGAVGQYERELIRDRVRAGVARAKAKGKRWGNRGVAPEIEAQVVAALGTGSLGKIAAKFGLGKSTVRDIKNRQPQVAA